MTIAPTAPQAAAMAEIVRAFISLAPRLKTAVPEDDELIAARKRLYAAHGEHPDYGDFGLFLSLCQALDNQEPMTMGDISRVLNVPLSTATRIVDVLVKSENVVRLNDPDDRRVVRIALTDTGKAMYHAILGAMRRRAERLLHPFTPDERETLIALLRKLVAGLEESL